MNGRNARKRMINKIKTTIWKKQEKFARQKATERILIEISKFTLFEKIKFIFTGKL